MQLKSPRAERSEVDRSSVQDVVAAVRRCSEKFDRWSPDCFRLSAADIDRTGSGVESQAEHGPDSPAVLVTSSERVARATIAHVEHLLVDLPTRDYAAPAWRDHGQVIVTETVDEAFAARLGGDELTWAPEQAEGARG